jgi:hypothetical protein
MKATILAAAILVGATAILADSPKTTKPEAAQLEESARLIRRGTEAKPVVNRDLLLALLKVKRIHVEKLAGGEAANQIRDMLIATIHASGIFILTEDAERADAILRGSAEDLVFTDQFQINDGISARAQLGLPGSDGRYSSRTNTGITLSENDAVRKTERKHEAVASVRLVSRDGDVLWSTTQESAGAKFRGSGADVADKVGRKLREAFEEALRLTSKTVPSGQ